VIYSGLDWSGSPGLEQGPWLVLAVVHFDDAELAALDTALRRARKHLGFPPRYVFKHNRAKGSKEIHDQFYDALRAIDFAAHVHMLNTEAWHALRSGKTRDVDGIRAGILDLVLGCPDRVIAGQVLFIDLPAAEAPIAQQYKTAIRQALMRIDRKGFREVRPCPDDRLQGGIIQAADMIAGEVREHGGLLGPYLPSLGARVQQV
jgi:hypothetical protein